MYSYKRVQKVRAIIVVSLTDFPFFFLPVGKRWKFEKDARRYIPIRVASALGYSNCKRKPMSANLFTQVIIIVVELAGSLSPLSTNWTTHSDVPLAWCQF